MPSIQQIIDATLGEGAGGPSVYDVRNGAGQLVRRLSWEHSVIPAGDERHYLASLPRGPGTRSIEARAGARMV